MNTNGEGEEVRVTQKISHYYGDLVRKCFLIAGVILLVAVLRDSEFVQFYFVIGVGLVLILTVLAGLTSPKNKFAVILNTLVAGSLFGLFEYMAADYYLMTRDFVSEIFFLRQLLAIIFLVALYFSTKTLREMH